MKGAGARQRSSDMERALELAWPNGVPDKEWSLLAPLPEEMKAVVAERLWAVLRWTGEMAGEPLSAAEAADLGGVTVKRLYALAAAWRERRSVASLGAGAASKPVHKARLGRELREAALRVIADALQRDRDVGPASLMRELEAGGMASLSRTVVDQLAIEARSNLPPQAFGSRLIFDSVGLDAVSDFDQRMRLYLVIDEGSGLVLGWADATSRSRAWGHVHAGTQARAELPSLDLSGFELAAERPEVLLVPQHDDDLGAQVLRRRFAGAAIPVKMNGPAPGRTAMNVLGRRLGPLWIGPDWRSDKVSYRNRRPKRMPEYTAELSIEVQEALEAHNARRRLGAKKGVSEADEIAAAKERVQEVLSVVADADADLESIRSYSEGAVLEELDMPPSRSF